MNVKLMGAGGVGFWLGVSLSRAGVPYTVYDADTLEGGLGYARMPKASPTTKKVNLLRGHVLAVMGDSQMTTVDRFFEASDAAEGDLVVDATDMALPARRSLWEQARANGARMLRVSYDGKEGVVVVAEGLPMGGRAGGGYSDVPNLALSFIAGGMGAMAVMALLKGDYKHIEFQVSMAELLAAPALAAMLPIAPAPLAIEPSRIEARPRRRQRRVQSA